MKALLVRIFFLSGNCHLSVEDTVYCKLCKDYQFEASDMWGGREGGGGDQRDTSSCMESQSVTSAGHSALWHAICPLATLSQHCCEAAKIKQSPVLVN